MVEFNTQGKINTCSSKTSTQIIESIDYSFLDDLEYPARIKKPSTYWYIDINKASANIHELSFVIFKGLNFKQFVQDYPNLKGLFCFCDNILLKTIIKTELYSVNNKTTIIRNDNSKK